MKVRTGAAKYFERRLRDPAYSEAHRQASAKVGAADDMGRAIDSDEVPQQPVEAEVAGPGGCRSGDQMGPDEGLIKAAVKPRDGQVLGGRTREPSVPKDSTDGCLFVCLFVCLSARIGPNRAYGR